MSPFALDHVYFYGRDYEEVLGMLMLEEAGLKGKKILDCPSGPDAFVGEAHKRGLDVIGCDPLYEKPVEDIVALGAADIDDAEQVIAKTGLFKGDGENETFHDSKRAALKKFAADFPEGKAAGRYVHAALPKLPFEDNTFDLVLSANFLFSYSSNRWGGLSLGDTFDLTFHIAAVRELQRVCRGEMRLYPIMTQDGSDHLHPFAAQIIGQLAADGVPIQLKDSPYNQGAITGHQVLIVECRD